MNASEIHIYSSYNEENSLEKTLERTTRWNAVLLLDDSDVYLEQRSIYGTDRSSKFSQPQLVW
jgi:hypothetical protein